jgi:hypothetical protein
LLASKASLINYLRVGDLLQERARRNCRDGGRWRLAARAGVLAFTHASPLVQGRLGVRFAQIDWATAAGD